MHARKRPPTAAGVTAGPGRLSAQSSTRDSRLRARVDEKSRAGPLLRSPRPHAASRPASFPRPRRLLGTRHGLAGTSRPRSWLLPALLPGPRPVRLPLPRGSLGARSGRAVGGGSGGPQERGWGRRAVGATARGGLCAVTKETPAGLGRGSGRGVARASRGGRGGPTAHRDPRIPVGTRVPVRTAPWASWKQQARGRQLGAGKAGLRSVPPCGGPPTGRRSTAASEPRKDGRDRLRGRWRPGLSGTWNQAEEFHGGTSGGGVTCPGDRSTSQTPAVTAAQPQPRLAGRRDKSPGVEPSRTRSLRGEGSPRLSASLRVLPPPPSAAPLLGVRPPGSPTRPQPPGFGRRPSGPGLQLGVRPSGRPDPP